MTIQYSVNSDGTITQDGEIVMPSAAEVKLFEEKVWRWADLALANQARVGVPASWTLAIINSESGGNPNAEGPPTDHGIGLMQITHPSLKQGLSDAEVFVPENNVRLGTDFMTVLMKKIGDGADVAKIASMFNCGPGAHGPKTGNGPWGYCEYKIPSTGAYPYISKVVRINNYAALKLKDYAPTSPPTDEAPPPEDAIDEGEGASPIAVVGASALVVLGLLFAARRAGVL